MTLIFQKRKLRQREVAMWRPQGHGICKWPWQGWNLYLSAYRVLSITHFFHRAEMLRKKVAWKLRRTSPLYKETSPPLPGPHPHLVEQSSFTFLRKQSNYPSRSQGVPEGLNQPRGLIWGHSYYTKFLPEHLVLWDFLKLPTIRQKIPSPSPWLLHSIRHFPYLTYEQISYFGNSLLSGEI